jgi:hypothetical protein
MFVTLHSARLDCRWLAGPWRRRNFTSWIDETSSGRTLRYGFEFVCYGCPYARRRCGLRLIPHRVEQRMMGGLSQRTACASCRRTSDTDTSTAHGPARRYTSSIVRLPPSHTRPVRGGTASRRHRAAPQRVVACQHSGASADWRLASDGCFSCEPYLRHS